MPDPGRDIVYFDLETQRSAGDVGGFGKRDRMKMSVGVTFSTRTGEYRIFREHEAGDLAQQLMQAGLVVGFNHVGFDYGVLQPYTLFTLIDHTVNLDLLIDLEQRLGRRVPLEAVAKPTLGAGKTHDGTQAILWWREGKIREIAEYCAYDVKVTRGIHEFGVRHGFVRYLDTSGREQQVPVSW